MTSSHARPYRVFAGSIGLFAALVLAPAASRAEDDREAPEPAGESAQTAADAGTFSTWSMAARSDTQKAFVQFTGGYDAAKDGALFETVMEARIMGPLSFRAGGSYIGPDGEFRPLFHARVDALRQEKHGVDLAVASGYEPHGFNTVQALATTVAVGRSVDRLRLLANVGYGLGLEEGEHFGDMRLAALYRVGDRVRAGLDSRFRMDLERDSDEPEGEPDWEAVVGPLATVTVGRYALSGGFGVSAIRLRLEAETNVGPIGYLGLGAVF